MNSKFLNIRYIILLHLIIGAAFIAYVTPILDEVGLQSDSPHYLEIAGNLSEKGEFALDGQTTAYRPPIYPFFIALVYKIFGEHNAVVMYLQLLLSCLNIFLFYKVAQRYLAERYAKLAALFYTIMPAVILFNAMIMSETVFMTILLAFLYVSRRNSSLFGILLAGALIALLTLTKPYWFFTAVIPAWYIFREKFTTSQKAIRIGLLTFGIGLLLIPWIARNVSEVGTYQITTNSGVNFWIGNNEYAHGGYLYEHHPDNKLAGIGDEVLRSQTGWQLGLEYILQNPERLPLLALKKLKRTFTLMYDQLYYFYKRERHIFPIQYVSYIPKLPALVIFAPYMLFFLPGAYGFFAYRKKFKIFAFLFSALIAVMLVFFGEGRFIYPIFPFMIISAVYLFEIGHKPDFTSRNLIPLLVVIMIVSVWLHDIIKAIVFF